MRTLERIQELNTAVVNANTNNMMSPQEKGEVHNLVGQALRVLALCKVVTPTWVSCGNAAMVLVESDRQPTISSRDHLMPMINTTSQAPFFRDVQISHHDAHIVFGKEVMSHLDLPVNKAFTTEVEEVEVIDLRKGLDHDIDIPFQGVPGIDGDMPFQGTSPMKGLKVIGKIDLRKAEKNAALSAQEYRRELHDNADMGSFSSYILSLAKEDESLECRNVLDVSLYRGPHANWAMTKAAITHLANLGYKIVGHEDLNCFSSGLARRLVTLNF